MTTQLAEGSGESSFLVREFLQDGKKFLPISNQKKRNVCVVPCIFNGEVRVHIRDFFPAEPEEEEWEETAEVPQQAYLFPTTRGVSLRVEEFNNLCASIDTAKKQVKRLLDRNNKKKTPRPITLKVRGHFLLFYHFFVLFDKY